MYGRTTSSSSDGIGADDRRRDDDRDDGRVERVERAMVGIIIGFLIVFLSMFLYKVQFLRHFRDNALIMLLNSKKVILNKIFHSTHNLVLEAIFEKINFCLTTFVVHSVLGPTTGRTSVYIVY